MKKIFELLLRLFSGFFTCALGIVFMLNSNLGAGPWDVFHQGLSNNTFLTIGQASIIVGFIVIGTTTLFKLKIGVGTVLNMIFIGLFTDLVLFTKLVPISDNILSGLIMIIIGMLLMSLGTYLYISCELGCGPRDGLMVVLTKITKKPVSTIRGVIEIGALIAGYLLGGHVGIGTFIIALGLGYCMKFIFKKLNLDVSSLNHRSIKDTYNLTKVFIREARSKSIENIET